MAIVIVMASATIKIAMKISIIIINQLNLGGGKTTEDITQANDENHKKKKKGATLGECEVPTCPPSAKQGHKGH